jgi:hypothetical protein
MQGRRAIISTRHPSPNKPGRSESRVERPGQGDWRAMSLPEAVAWNEPSPDKVQCSP